MGRKRLFSCILALALAGFAAPEARALDRLTLRLEGDENETLEDRLKSASVLRAANRDKVDDPQDLLAAALSDYTRLLETLYAYGYYSGTISILIDGREAALIPPLETPARIGTIAISVNPGPLFRFGTASVAPLAPGTSSPPDFRPGERARATAVSEAVDGAVSDWRAAGHAKVAPSRQDITANHATRILNARVSLSPGPRVSFGKLNVEPGSAVRPTRIRKIAGIPEGEVFSPDVLDKAAIRLRRTGTFRSVRLIEADTLGPGDTMDITARVVDEKPRRFGLGAEISSFEGLRLTGFWLHRNLLGGAERFRVEGEVAGIGGDTGGIDYRLGARLDRPAVFGPDTSAYIEAEIERLEEPDYTTETAKLVIGAHRIFTDTLSADLGVGIGTERTTDAFGRRDFTLLALPAALTWDTRDDLLNATSGYYLRAEATPFLAIEGTDDGALIELDVRAYRALDDAARLVLAGRLQLGALVGPSLEDAPPSFLFHSGGGGTVRGQPYQSLGVDLGGGDSTGGRSFLGLSGEIRAKVVGDFSVVAFADAGYVGREELYDGSGDWHAGAGLGLRYDTVVGPIRLDVAAPISGDTGDGVQLYIGIGQAF